jgi:formate dehydrogenase subunit gamma
MTRSIKRHSLQARITHGVTACSCILLAISGLFVLVPPLTATLPAHVVFTMRMAHRGLGIIFIAVPLISALTAPKGVARLARAYFAKWDKDDATFMKRFVPYMLGPKRVHMPDQHEVKSGQRVADGLLFIAAFLIAASGVTLLLGTSTVTFSATVMLVAHFVHDLAFILFCVFGVAHIFLGSGIFQPYRGLVTAMFGNGRVSESAALYHWGHWARAELEDGTNVVEED